MNNNNFMDGGREQHRQALRAEIEQQVHAKYAAQRQDSHLYMRVWYNVVVWLEIRRRIRQVAAEDVLYLDK